jgi:hypothetical protein
LFCTVTKVGGFFLVCRQGLKGFQTASNLLLFLISGLGLLFTPIAV